MKPHYTLLSLIAVTFFLSPANCFGQGEMLGDNVFLKGHYTEVAVGPNGAFGSTINPPSGYHNNVYQTFTDPGGGSSGSTLGFVADPDMDGWGTGTPNYMGDYFMPGTPQEGWAMMMGGTENNAYMPNYWFSSAGYSAGYSPSASGAGLIGYGTGGSGTVSYSMAGSVETAVWKGHWGPLVITQITTLDSNKLYFIAEVKIKDTATTDATDVYYMRTVDPDNEEPWTGSIGFTTDNKIVYTIPDPSNKVLVTANGTGYPGHSYLGLGTEDCRAMPYICNGGLYPYDYMDAIYAETSSNALYTGEVTADEGIGIIFKLGTIAAGDSTELKYAYILNESELDSAFALTAPILSEGGSVHPSIDSVVPCNIAGGLDTVIIDNGGDYSWSWSPGTALSDSVGDTVVIYLDSITSTITYTVTGVSTTPGLCALKTFTVVVPPGALATPTTTPVYYCQGAAAVALTATGTNLTWYTSSSGGVGDTAAPTPSTAVAGVDTYWVTQKIGYCESNRVPALVIVNPLPAPDVTNNSPICEGSDLVFSATDSTYIGATYSWTGPSSSGFTSTAANPDIPGVTVAADGTYSVTMTIPGCPPITGTTYVSINPGVSITGVSSVDPTSCSMPNGEIILLGGTAGETYMAHYTKDGTADSVSVTADGTGTVTIGSLGPGTYTNIYLVAPDGCASNIVGPVTLHGASTPMPAANDTTYCQGAAALPLYAVGDSLLWYTSATGGSGTATLIPSTTTVGMETYYVTQTVNGCESPRKPVNVTILALPAAPVFSPNTPLCAGDILVLTPSGSTGGNTYTWQGPDSFYSTVTDVSLTVDSSASGTYSLTVTDASGCTSLPYTSNVVVHPIPAPPQSGTFTYCQRDPEIVIPVVGQNLTWYSGPTGGTGDTSAQIINTKVADSFTIYVTQTISGCESPRVPATVVVNYSPIAHISPSKPEVCVADTITLANDGYLVPGEEYMWSVPGDGTLQSGSVDGSAPLTVVFSNSGMHTIYLSTSNALGGCTTLDTLYLNVLALPVAHLQISPHDACPGQQVTIALSSANETATSFVWNFDGGTAISRSENSGGPYLVTWPATGSEQMYTVTVRAYNDLMCPNVMDAKDSIVVHLNPVAQINKVSSSDICSGDSVAFSMSAYDDKNQYIWTPLHYFNNTNSSSIWGKVDLTGYVKLTVTSPYGCESVDSTFITAQPCCTVTFPSAFTPNNDGHNDVFRPVTLGHHQLHVFRIENRWGQTIFSTTQERQGWDGTFNGVPQDIGVYYYYIKYDCDGKTVEEHGDVTLVR